MPKALNPHSILLRPLITEKATRLHGENKYAFEVEKHANKAQIKQAVETSFTPSVKVSAVNIMIMKGKSHRVRGNRMKQGQDWKKAIVTLEEGDKLTLFEGM
jgi:large subunit ribosomal protein L23